MKTTTHSARAMLVAAILSTGVLLGGAACGGSNGPKPGEYHIPIQETAQEQFAVARRQQRNAEGVYDVELRDKELQIAIRAYQKVGELFPNDDDWTPVAELLIADLKRDLEKHNEAVAQYDAVVQKYPNDSTVRYSALFGMGQSLDALQRPQDAETYYRLLIDEATLSGESSDAVQEMVGIARRRVRTIQVLE